MKLAERVRVRTDMVHLHAAGVAVPLGGDQHRLPRAQLQPRAEAGVEELTTTVRRHVGRVSVLTIAQCPYLAFDLQWCAVELNPSFEIHKSSFQCKIHHF